MPRTLVYTPPVRGLLVGTTPITPGYSHGYTQAEMRQWADDLDRLYKTVEADRSLPADQRRLQTWLATPRDQLSPQARGVVEAHDKLMNRDNYDRGIKGDLLPDGRVELSGGRHRANYILERGTAPVPVWVSSHDPQRLDDFRLTCHDAVDRARPGLLNPDRNELQTRAPGRPALAGRAQTREPSPQTTQQIGRVAVGGANDRQVPTETTRELGRIAVEGDRAEPTPDRHLTREFGERTRDRGVFGVERER